MFVISVAPISFMLCFAAPLSTSRLPRYPASTRPERWNASSENANASVSATVARPTTALWHAGSTIRRSSAGRSTAERASVMRPLSSLWRTQNGACAEHDDSHTRWWGEDRSGEDLRRSQIVTSRYKYVYPLRQDPLSEVRIMSESRAGRYQRPDVSLACNQGAACDRNGSSPSL